MKIMKYIVPALLGGMLTLQSCEHFLDTKPTETCLLYTSPSPRDTR